MIYMSKFNFLKQLNGLKSSYEMIISILPIHDTKPHIEDSTCECEPEIKIIETGDIIMVHNSFDGREIIEKINELIK